MTELLLRSVLLLYPARLRRQFGAEMLDYMRIAHARARQQRAGVGFWRRLAIDTLRALPLAYSGGPARPGRRDRDPLLRGFAGDVRLAVRSLARRPGFAAAVVATLALGIGASTAVFSIVNGVLLAPLPYPEPDRLVAVVHLNGAGSRWGLSAADFLAMHEQQRSFSSVAVMTERDVILGGQGEPEWARAMFVSADFFRTVGIVPDLGRDFAPAEGEYGAAHVVVVARELARRMFGEESAVGSSITLDGTPHAIVGVLPEGIDELAGRRGDVWPIMQLEPPQRRGPFLLRGVARLRTDRSIEDARTDLADISERIFPIWQAGFKDATAKLTPLPLQDLLVGSVRERLTLIFAAVLLVLLVSVANVANLMLARAAERQTEFALRTALGAATGRLARWLLAESLVLASLGATLGIALAAAALAAFRNAGVSLPRLAEVGLQLPAVAFAVSLAVVAAILLGMTPLLAGGSPDLSRALREGSRSALAGRRAGTARGALVVLELAVTVPLLLSAGLLLTSLASIQRVDPGYRPQGAFSVRISLPPATYPDPDSHARFWERTLASVAEVPGVVAAGASNILPPDAYGWNNNFDLVDRPVQPGEPEPTSPWAIVAGPFLEALGAPLLEGRTFTREDFAGTAPPAVVVSESWARRYYPGESAVGRQLYSGGDRDNPMTVIGVIGDVKFAGLTGDSEAVYSPGGGGWLRSLRLLVRTGADTSGALEAVRERLREIDAGLPLTDVESLQQRIDDSVTGPRQWTLLLVAFAVAATLLTAVGIFGVVANAVRGQTREIGLRMALGATSSEVVGWVVRRAMARVALGIALGLGLAAVSLRWLQSFLFAVSPADPLNALGACALLAAVALLACWLPGRAAAKVDPIVALSGD